MSRFPEWNLASSNSVHGEPVSIDKMPKRQVQCQMASIVKESTIPGQQKCLQVLMKKHGILRFSWLDVATARAETVAAALTVLQELPSTHEQGRF